MVCRSGKVATAAQKSEKAMKVLNDFTAKVMAQATAYEAKFKEQVTAELKLSGITDETYPIAFGIQQQTEYTSEFNVGKIADVVKALLKTLGTVVGKDGKVTVATATSADAINSYTQFVSSLAASLRSSSSSSSAFTFQMTKVGPGIFACISAMTANIKDEDTFGSEAVSSTVFVYTFAESLTDLKLSTNFNIELIRQQTRLQAHEIAAKNIITLKNAQSNYLRKFANGDLPYDQYQNINQDLQKAIDQQEAELDNMKSPAVSLVAVRMSLAEQDMVQLLTIESLLACSNSETKTKNLKHLKDMAETRLEAFKTALVPTSAGKQKPTSWGCCFGLCAADSVAADPTELLPVKVFSSIVKKSDVF